MNYLSLEDQVQGIIQDVAANGDKAVSEYSSKFDQVNLSEFEVSIEEIEAAKDLVDDPLRKAIDEAH